jgi:Flp pilus assembly protein TadD
MQNRHLFWRGDSTVAPEKVADGNSPKTIRYVVANRPRSKNPCCFAIIPTLALRVSCFRAAELEPGRARYTYVCAVALHSAGRRDDALAALKAYLNRRPKDRDILLALVTFSRDAGDLTAALDYGQQLALIAPDDREIASFRSVASGSRG